MRIYAYVKSDAPVLPLRLAFLPCSGTRLTFGKASTGDTSKLSPNSCYLKCSSSYDASSGYRSVLCWGIKRSRRVFNNSSSSTAETRNEWASTSLPSVYLRCKSRDKFTWMTAKSRSSVVLFGQRIPQGL